MILLPLHDSNPLRIIPYQRVTVAIIALCLAVFAYQQLASPENAEAAVLSFGLLPAVLFEHRVLASEFDLLPAELTLLSSMFLHDGWMHLVGNMLFLWVFGDNIEDSMGHGKFLVFYLLCGILAGLAHAVAEFDSVNPLIGASGAISAVLGAYLVLHPRVKVLLLVFMRIPLYLPAYLVLGGWLGLQIYFIATDDAGRTAWWAHVGGFVVGAMLIPFFKHDSVPLFDRGIAH